MFEELLLPTTKVSEGIDMEEVTSKSQSGIATLHLSQGDHWVASYEE